MSNEDIKKQVEGIWSMLDDMASTDKTVHYLVIYLEIQRIYKRTNEFNEK